MSQIIKALCLGPLAVVGLIWSALTTSFAVIGDGLIASGRAVAAVGGSLKAFAPVGRAAATASKEVGPRTFATPTKPFKSKAAQHLVSTRRRDGGALCGWTPPSR